MRRLNSLSRKRWKANWLNTMINEPMIVALSSCISCGRMSKRLTFFAHRYKRVRIVMEAFIHRCSSHGPYKQLIDLLNEMKKTKRANEEGITFTFLCGLRSQSCHQLTSFLESAIVKTQFKCKIEYYSNQYAVETTRCPFLISEYVQPQFVNQEYTENTQRLMKRLLGLP